MEHRLTAPLRAVLFDLDGTLLDTADDLADAANRMLDDLRLPRREPALIRRFIGKGVARLVERAVCGSLDGRASPRILDEALALFERHYEAVSGRRTRVFPGVLEGLSLLHLERVPLGCVTNKPERFTHALLAQTGLAGFFAVVVGGDTLDRRKPDPLPYRHACERLGAAPGETLVVGDSANDVAAARAAGCAVVCVPYGYNEGAPVEDLDCDAIVPSVAEAAKLVARLRAAHSPVPAR